jgi:hypothetical protein
MNIDDFPVPITLIHDEVEYGAKILVHRMIPMAHCDHNCPCEPHAFTRKEVEAMTVDQMNNLLRREIN